MKWCFLPHATCPEIFICLIQKIYLYIYACDIKCSSLFTKQKQVVRDRKKKKKRKREEQVAPHHVEVGSSPRSLPRFHLLLCFFSLREKWFETGKPRKVTVLILRGWKLILFLTSHFFCLHNRVFKIFWGVLCQYHV